MNSMLNLVTFVVVHNAAEDGRTDRWMWVGRCVRSNMSLARGIDPTEHFVRRSVSGFRRPFRRGQLFSVTLIIVNAVILSNGEAYLQVTRL